MQTGVPIVEPEKDVLRHDLVEPYFNDWATEPVWPSS